MALSSQALLSSSSSFDDDGDDKTKGRRSSRWWQCLFVWVSWKVALVVFWYYYWASTTAATTKTTSKQEQPLRVLYIVTSLAEYNNGRRDTVKDQDRLAEVLLPTVVEGVASMTQNSNHNSNHNNNHNNNIHVDVYLILAYSLRPEREQYIRDSIPAPVTIWDNALPMGYDKSQNSKNKDVLQANTRALARQHRYVVRDQLENYDVFAAFEDDMVVKASHLKHYYKYSAYLEALKPTGPELTQTHIDRLIPGFVRVEVLLGDNDDKVGKTDDLKVPVSTAVDPLDPRVCCHVPHRSQFPDTSALPMPLTPTLDRVVLWETHIRALRVLTLPDENVVGLLPGPGKRLAESEKLTSNVLWSGELDHSYFGDTPPSPGEPKLIAQQGGWMLTRRQLLRLMNGLCGGSFLPPFDNPVYRDDGLESMNVEYWSGSYQLFTGVLGGCNMQRVVHLPTTNKNADDFDSSAHFLYHAANNKQRQLRHRLVRLQDLWGQWETVRQATTAVSPG